MSKRDEYILAATITVFILFLLNYFITVPIINRSLEQLEQVEVLDDKILQLQLDIAQGEELSQAILESDSRITAIGLELSDNDNYSVHNRFVDTATEYGLLVSALALGDSTAVVLDEQTQTIETVADHELVVGQLSLQEVELINSYYKVVRQPITVTVTGSVYDIIEYVTEMSRDDIYTVMTSAEIDTYSNEADITVALQFEQYRYIINTDDI